jgi:catechol 2,3-dioxygenase-like lactoylglutathione lyase family enzyme
MPDASRPLFVRRAIVLLAGLTALPAMAGGTVDSVGITVRDLDRAAAFYRDVLEFTPQGEWELAGDDEEHVLGVFGARVRVSRLALGGEAVELMQFLTPTGREPPADSRSNDRWFQHVAIIVDDMDRAYARLRQHGVAHASTGPQRLPDWNANAGGIEAFYFRDPDGNHLEVLEFPPGKGDPRWQSTERLFLGIDHTAIVVGSTDDSLRWYRDVLGMNVVGASENYGPEQERLNNVFGARLRITALKADRGIGVELLEYLAPRTGRAMPVDTLASDGWHWQVNFMHADLAALATAVLGSAGLVGGPQLVSPGIVTFREKGRLGSAALMARDPDGHASLHWMR